MNDKVENTEEKIETTVSLEANGMAEAVVVDTTKLSPAITSKLVAFGLKELTNNALASAKKNEWTPEERTERVQEKMAALLEGKWLVRSSSGPSVTPLEKHTRRIALGQVRGTVKAMIKDKEFEIPRKQDDFLETEFVLDNNGKDIKVSGEALLQKAMQHPKVIAAAEQEVAIEEQRKAAAEEISLI